MSPMDDIINPSCSGKMVAVFPSLHLDNPIIVT